MTTDAWLAVLAVVLVGIAGLLSAAETAIGRVSRSKVDEARKDGDRRAERLLVLLDDRPRHVNVLLFLSTVARVTATVIVGYVCVDALAIRAGCRPSSPCSSPCSRPTSTWRSMASSWIRRPPCRSGRCGLDCHCRPSSSQPPCDSRARASTHADALGAEVEAWRWAQPVASRVLGSPRPALLGAGRKALAMARTAMTGV